MSATEIIDQIGKLPADEKAKVFGWFVDEFEDDEAFFAWCDSLPKTVEMTEEEILALPRMIPADARPAR